MKERGKRRWRRRGRWKDRRKGKGRHRGWRGGKEGNGGVTWNEKKERYSEKESERKISAIQGGAYIICSLTFIRPPLLLRKKSTSHLDNLPPPSSPYRKTQPPFSISPFPLSWLTLPLLLPHKVKSSSCLILPYPSLILLTSWSCCAAPLGPASASTAGNVIFPFAL